MRLSKSAHQKLLESIPEATVHTHIVSWLTLVLDPETTYFTSVEVSNQQGGNAGFMKQARNKQRGVKTGFPDIHILHKGAGFYLEVKRHGKDATDPQKLEHEKIRKAGGIVAIVHNIEEVKQFFKAYNIPTKEKLYV